MNKLRVIAAAITLAMVSSIGPALGHDPKPQHGGRIVIAGTYHVEMVVKGQEVLVYLLDHSDKPVTAKGRKGVAILMIDGKSTRISLESQESRLAGKAPVALPVSPKGVVQITEPTGGTVQARFN